MGGTLLGPWIARTIFGLRLRGTRTRSHAASGSTAVTVDGSVTQGWVWLLPGPLEDGAGSRTKAKLAVSTREKDCFRSVTMITEPWFTNLYPRCRHAFSKWPSLVLSSTGVLQSLTWIPKLSQRHFCHVIVAVGEEEGDFQLCHLGP